MSSSHDQAHSGLFHLLPLGLRVQSKLEALIDTHMQSIGASKASLSSLTTEALWRQSGRYTANSEFLRIKDRRESGFLLSPTHEEEITALVAGMVHSYKDLPLRLYQTGRKYRDEKRPRGGLLRAKEFMMKDLYTFDSTPAAALETYDSVRRAYAAIFDALKLPYLVAAADSGNMGGKLSHEYHFASPKGEDTVWSCSKCDYIANEEVLEKRPSSHEAPEPCIFEGISTDHKTRIQIQLPSTSGAPTDWENITHHVNLHAVKRLLAQLHPGVDIDTGIEATTLAPLLKSITSPGIVLDSTDTSTRDLTSIIPGSGCPNCPTGDIAPQKAIEVAHTFHLGTRYSKPLGALVALPDGKTRVPMEMGCHGIGISRLVGAIASLLADEKGLNWPRVVAPYEAIILTTAQVGDGEAGEVYDALSSGSGEGKEGVDVVLDDRPDKNLGWKLRDADLIGYPVLLVLGRGWRERREVEVQCRRLGVKQDVGVGQLRDFVGGILEKL
jgi:prolyl-tRNA synthetase